jgi:murein DD-endopeptidase MepM/ murein hydrolase activator NlpD
VKVLLAHMGTGSVLVRPGQGVTTGQALGVIGNSGNTSEPHLHVHAERGGRPGAWGEGEGVPILFEGKFLCRNDLVTPARWYVADEPAQTKTAGA